MFEKLNAALPDFARKDLTFEMIQHRFTKPAKRVIQENYPMTKLELDESNRSENGNGEGTALGNMFIRTRNKKILKTH